MDMKLSRLGSPEWRCLGDMGRRGKEEGRKRAAGSFGPGHATLMRRNLIF